MIRSRRTLTRSFVTWVMAVIGLGGSLLNAGDPVAVFVRDGRILTGEIDTKTTEAELWLHSAEPSILILSSIPWSDVISAKVAEQTLTTAELQSESIRLRRRYPFTYCEIGNP